MLLFMPLLHTADKATPYSDCEHCSEPMAVEAHPFHVGRRRSWRRHTPALGCLLAVLGLQGAQAQSPSNWDFTAPWKDFEHHEIVLGPVQRSEAMFIYGLLRLIRPRRVVEFGLQTGASTRIICEAVKDYAANVTSYDLNLDEAKAAELRALYPFLTTHGKDQQEFSAAQKVDFVFFDGAHDFGVNKATWKKVLPLLESYATVMVHDTGMWTQESIEGRPSFDFGKPGTLFGVKGRFHQPDEVQFVEWVTRTQQSWTRVDLGSVNTFRHGITLLQRKRQSRIEGLTKSA